MNTLKTSRAAALAALRAAGVGAALTPLSPLGIRLSERVPLGRIPGLSEGALDIQDEVFEHIMRAVSIYIYIYLYLYIYTYIYFYLSD